jgi:hypothetical protein
MRTVLWYSSSSISARPPFTPILHRRSCTRVCAPDQQIEITMGLNFHRELACPLLRLPVASRHFIGVQPQPRA